MELSRWKTSYWAWETTGIGYTRFTEAPGNCVTGVYFHEEGLACALWSEETCMIAYKPQGKTVKEVKKELTKLLGKPIDSIENTVSIKEWYWGTVEQQRG